MDPMKLYYYTSVPLLTCNILFYSVTTLSNSITSTQNVFKFVYEHKDSDFELFKNELDALDLYNKLKIIESLIFDIIHKYCKSDEEFNFIKDNIKNPLITVDDNKVKDYSFINLENRISIFDKMEEPIRYTLLITSESIQNINNIINVIHNKVLEKEKSYFKGFITVKLTNELSQLHKNVKLLDMRMQILFDLLKIYIPKK
jgi:hypothetical protein